MTPANWSLNRVPMSTDDVCITAPGTCTVELTNSTGGIVAPTVNPLTAGGAKASGSQALDVHGQDPNNVVAGYVASPGVTTTTSIPASGIAQLRAQDHGAGVSFFSDNTANSDEIITQPRGIPRASLQPLARLCHNFSVTTRRWGRERRPGEYHRGVRRDPCCHCHGIWPRGAV